MKTSSLCQKQAKMFMRSGAKPDDIINTGKIHTSLFTRNGSIEKEIQKFENSYGMLIEWEDWTRHHCSKRRKISERKFIPINSDSRNSWKLFDVSAEYRSGSSTNGTAALLRTVS